MKTSKYIGIGVAVAILLSCNHKNGLYDASGTFEAIEIVVSSEVSGKVLSLDIREGEILQADQLVGSIDSTQLHLQKKQLASNIRAIESRKPQIKTQIAVTEQQISSQKIEKNRVEKLLEANAANRKQLDDLNAHIALLEKQLEAQKSSLLTTTQGITQDVETIEIQIEQLDDQLKKCQIINPLTGTVLAKYTEAMELATPGKALYKIADLDKMVLRAYITSGQLTQLKMGQQVKVFADFGEERREYEGIVSWISDKSEFTPKTIQTKDERANLVYAVKIAVQNDGYLKIGMYGQIQL